MEVPPLCRTERVASKFDLAVISGKNWWAKRYRQTEISLGHGVICFNAKLGRWWTPDIWGATLALWVVANKSTSKLSVNPVALLSWGVEMWRGETLSLLLWCVEAKPCRWWDTVAEYYILDGGDMMGRNTVAGETLSPSSRIWMLLYCVAKRCRWRNSVAEEENWKYEAGRRHTKNVYTRNDFVLPGSGEGDPWSRD